MIENEDFVKLIFDLDQRAGDLLPVRNTLKAWVVNYAKQVQNQVVANVQRAGSFFVALDLWSQPGLTYSYLGVTLSFHNSISKRIEVVALACRYLHHPHTAIRIREELKNIFDWWGFKETNVIRYITDRGANIICALSPYKIQQMIPIVASIDDLDSEKDDSDSDISENDVDEDGIGDEEAAHNNAVARDLQYTEEETEYQRAFPKRLSCAAHVLQLMCNTIIDKLDSPIQKVKRNVLALVNKFSKSGVANQNIKIVRRKKLLKVAQTRWNSFFYVAQRLLQLKPHIVTVCNEKDWPILFTWAELELCVDFLKPIAMATTYLEGDQYPTAASIIPSLLSLQDHLID